MRDEELVEEMMRKYKTKLDSKLGSRDFDQDTSPVNDQIISESYSKFKKELLPRNMSLYEKMCNFSESIFKISPDQKKIPELLEAIETAHLNITPTGVYSLSILLPMTIMVVGIMLSMFIPALMGTDLSTFFIVFSLIAGVACMFPLQKVPMFLANSWRLNASSQMVLCIFYVVTYMRHTSNLERAIRFASDHLSGPLALDLKKVLWDVETQKFPTIKESLDNYIDGWRKLNLEFI